MNGIYRKRDLWPLCKCVKCGSRRHIEPHGTDAYCDKCGKDTEHEPVEKKKWLR